MGDSSESAADGARPAAAGARLTEDTPLRFGLKVGIGLAVVVLAVVAAWQVRTVLMILLASGFMAVGLDRPVRRLMRKGLSRTWAATTVIAVGLAAVCGGMGLLLPPLIAQIAEFFAAVPELAQRALSSPYLEKYVSDEDLVESAIEAISPQTALSAVSGVLGGAASAVGVGFQVFTAFLLSIFLLAGLDRLRGGALQLFPASRREEVAEVLDQVLTKVGAYVVGSLTIAATAGVVSTVYMLIIGVPFAMLLGLVVAFLDLIPQVGATLAAIAASLVALTESLGLAVATALFFLVYQQLENWLIYPRVMNRAVQISNLGSVVAVLLGAALFGVLGVLVAVPGYATVQLLVRRWALPRLNAS